MKIGMMVNGNIFSYDGESSQAFEDSINAFMEAVTATQTTQDSGCSCTREVLKNRVDVSSTKRYINGSIDDIMQDIKDGVLTLNIGDVVPCELTDGQKVVFEVTDIDENGYRLEMKELLKTMAHTDMQKWYDTFYKSLLPASLKNAIIPTKRKYKKDGDGKFVEVYAMIFAPSASEVFSEEEFDDNAWLGDKGVYEQLDFYKDWRNRIRCTVEDGKPNAWWLLSAYAGNSTNFAYVLDYGDCSSDSATPAWIAAPVCFRIRKSK